MTAAAFDPEVDPRGTPYPPYVLSDAEKGRWSICTRAAEAMWRMHEPAQEPTGQWMWFTTRSLYESDVPTGSPDELEEGLGKQVAMGEAPVAALFQGQDGGEFDKGKS